MMFFSSKFTSCTSVCLWLYLEKQNEDSMIMDSCTQLTSLKPGHPVGFVWQAQMESRPQLRGRSFGWILELYRVATFAMLVAAGGMRREGKSLCRAKWVISMFALRRGRSHKGIKAERRSLLAVAHRSMSLQLELMHHLRRVVMHCNASSDLGRSVCASVKRRKEKKAAPRGMAKKVLWARRCHDVPQVLL